jgi:hypothetical protein
MATMAHITTDKSVDDLRVEMGEGFARSDKRVDDLRVEMREGFIRTDKRIDDLGSVTDQRFDRVESDARLLRSEVKALRTETQQGFADLDRKFDAKFDSLNRTIIVLLGGSLSVVTGGLLAAVFHAFG